MNGETQIDPEDLRRQGARLAGLGDRVGRTYAGLRDDLARSEGCWGDDDLGAAFAKDFKPQAGELLAQLQAMEESLHGMANGVVAAADQFESNDQASAQQIASTAEQLTGPQLGNGAGPYPAALSRAVPTPDVASPVPRIDAADRIHPAEQSSPAGPRTPVASGGPAASRDGSGPSDPPHSGAGRGGGDRPGQDGANPSVRDDHARSAPAPGAASPSGPTNDSAGIRRTPPAAKRGSGPSISAGETDTPWMRRTPTTAERGSGPSISSGQSDTPWARRTPTSGTADASDHPGSRSGSPPRPSKPIEGSPAGRDRRRPNVPLGAGWLARMLADRHAVEVVGFDMPGLNVSVVREFAAAVDRVLTDYPMIELDVVGIADVEGDPGCVRWSPDRRGEPGTGPVRSIILDKRTACESSQGAATSDSATGPEDLGIYVATVGELGRALDHVGGSRVCRRAQRVLIAEYMRLEGLRHSTIGEVVRGYQRWRSGLPGTAVGRGGFDATRAVSDAFADVVLHGDEASAPAKALHAALLDAASPE